MCQRVLTKEGFEVDIAVNGRLAQDMIGKKQYHLCLIDVRTPTMNGTELYQWLRKKHPRLAKKVVFTTGGVLDEQNMPFMEQTGRPFLPKPFTPDELIAVMQKALK
jgi:DNA-binding response OmpR family regulator